jgi:hypothetical protein
VQGTRTRPKVVVAGGARGVVGHAGARLLTDLADKAGLTSGFVQALGLDRVRRPTHEPGRVAVDLAVLLADGGEAIADLAVLRQQSGLFGRVASDPTAWRVLDAIDAAALARLRAARAAARELAWLQLLETRRSFPATTVLARALPGFVLDIDATIVLAHSEKEAAAPTWKHTFGFHPLLCFLDATGEALAGLLRSGNAGSNTAADHVTVLDQALQQIPEQYLATRTTDVIDIVIGDEFRQLATNTPRSASRWPSWASRRSRRAPAPPWPGADEAGLTGNHRPEPHRHAQSDAVIPGPAKAVFAAPAPSSRAAGPDVVESLRSPDRSAGTGGVRLR